MYRLWKIVIFHCHFTFHGVRKCQDALNFKVVSVPGEKSCYEKSKVWMVYDGLLGGWAPT